MTTLYMALCTGTVVSGQFMYVPLKSLLAMRHNRVHDLDQSLARHSLHCQAGHFSDTSGLNNQLTTQSVTNTSYI